MAAAALPPATPLNIRRAVPADARSIAEIYNRALQERIATFETDERSEAAMRAWMEEHDTRHPVLVGETRGDLGAPGRGQRLIAWASISTYRPRACYSGVGEFSVYVREGFRGRHAGEQVLLALIDEARRLGYWKLVSRIFPQNTPSRRLVARCGFREVGVYEKHGKLDGEWLDTVIVERLIPENLQ